MKKAKKIKGWDLFPFLLVFYEIANYLANDNILPALPMLANDLTITPLFAQQVITVWFYWFKLVAIIVRPPL